MFYAICVTDEVALLSATICSHVAMISDLLNATKSNGIPAPATFVASLCNMGHDESSLTFNG